MESCLYFMQKNKVKVYFLGSGAFAVPFLDALSRADNIDLVGVGTQPDKPSGRKRLPKPTPLGGFADAVGIPCRRVASVSSDEFMQLMNELQPDIVVVVSFGQILRERLLNFPRFGCLNVHGSILPKYRGASPLATSILCGDKVNGITFMRMEKGLDTGPIYSITTMEVPPTMNSQTLEIALRGILRGSSTESPTVFSRFRRTTRKPLSPGRFRNPTAPSVGVNLRMFWNAKSGRIIPGRRPHSASWEKTAFNPSRSPRHASHPVPGLPERLWSAINGGSSPAGRALLKSSALSPKVPVK